MRSSVSKFTDDPVGLKHKLLAWAQQFSEAVYLDSNDYQQQYASYDAILAVDALTSITTDYKDSFKSLAEYQAQSADWLFGYLTYDLKNHTERLASDNFDGLGFPELFFFQPKKLFLLKGDRVEMLYLKMCDDEIETDWNDINGGALPTPEILKPVNVKQRIPREKYLDKAQRMLEYIHRGDIYEANLCMEFYADNAVIDPLQTYSALNDISSPPFAAYLKNRHYYLMCASPERYLRKEGGKVISQPIKGTARRSQDTAEDIEIKAALAADEKERSENIMIVDLVRNDLSRTATKGSVEVEELCKPYTFKQVHHLISTITSHVITTVSPVDILRSTFPMGSMTGAPKISAMKIIEELEDTKRGLYSGSVGYFTPGGDFDFNVVIRSILYNSQRQYVSFSVGSAITAKADPEQEYEECLLKARAMMQVLGG